MDELIATHYLPASQAGQVMIGGQPAHKVTDRRDPGRTLLAVQTNPALPPRARLLGGRCAAPVPHALMPLDHGPGRIAGGAEAYFIIFPEPPGRAIAADPHPWGEADLIRCLLLPAAAALDELAGRGIGHRAINPANIFRAGPGEKIVLGPCCTAPPASLQPAAFEPPYAAQCLPAGRGEGTPAAGVIGCYLNHGEVSCMYAALSICGPQPLVWQHTSSGEVGARTSSRGRLDREACT